MLLMTALTVAIAAPVPVQAVEQIDVAYEKMASGENAAAIAQLETNRELDSDDPSRLINLGVAYAREGNEVKARALFRAAVFSEKREVMETSTGEWVDSRVLARTALKQLDNGDFTRPVVVAVAE